MLFNLSLKNIKKSIKDYSIYFFTLVVAVAIFYLFNSMDAQESMLALTSSKREMIKSLVMILGYVSIFVSVILGFLIVYSNNFLIKRRKKEIGLYLTLGMSKRKVSTILVFETLLVGILSLIVGLLVGVGLSQLLSIFTAKIFEVDMTKFKFIFSSAALVKTIIYFGIIFILVMSFNVIALSRYKLIDLLNASKKSEKIKVRNKFVIFISFILTILLLGYAYKLLFDGALMTLDNTALKMIIAGSIGTFLLFFSISGVLLTIFQKSKKVYYKNLNIFVLRQINSRVNTTVISTTIISLMLLLTIGILSGSMSMASAFNSDLSNNNLTDFTLKCSKNTYEIVDDKYIPIKLEYTSMDNIINSNEFKSYSKDYVSFNEYQSNVVVKNLMSKKTIKKIKNEYNSGVLLNSPVLIIKESDYKKLMKIYGKEDDIVDIESDKYLLLANVDLVVDSYTDYYKNNNSIEINDKKLTPATDKIYETAIENYNSNGNDGIIVVSDELVDNLEISNSLIVGNYIKKSDKIDNAFIEYIFNNSNVIQTRTKLEMEAASVGITAILTFLGLYLGIIFAISSATVLAIGQLSESSDNKERYLVLRKLGSDNKMINKALFTQIAVAFIFPLIVALFHAFFGLKELNHIIKILGNINLTENIFLTTLFIVIVYGGYFLVTYHSSKNIIKDDNK